MVDRDHSHRVARRRAALWLPMGLLALAYGCAVGADEVSSGTCIVGSEGCLCTDGGACDPGLDCFSGFCVDGGGGSDSSSNGGQGLSSAQQGSNGAGGNGSGSVTASASNGATTAGASVSSSSAASSSVAASSSSGTCNLDAPTNVVGCNSCGVQCDSPWDVTWDAVAGATFYLVEYQCFMATPQYQTSNTTADLCTEVGMCSDSMCSFGVASVTVKACDGVCCSAPTAVPAAGAPITCGGGVCC